MICFEQESLFPYLAAEDGAGEGRGDGVRREER
jgi:hypothetical protein